MEAGSSGKHEHGTVERGGNWKSLSVEAQYMSDLHDCTIYSNE